MSGKRWRGTFPAGLSGHIALGSNDHVQYLVLLATSYAYAYAYVMLAKPSSISSSTYSVLITSLPIMTISSIRIP